MFCIFRTFAGLMILGGVAASLAAATAPELKLPGNAAPRSYRAELQIDPNGTSFKGHIEIAVDIKESIDTLWLNATDISIAETKFEVNGKQVPVHVVPGNTDFIGLHFDSPVRPGQAEVSITYTGKFRLHDSSGIFRMQEDGNPYIFTQFEQTDARAAFPCFDEPSYKVPWQLTLSVPQKYDAVSNTPIDKQETSGTQKVLHFRTTKPLPSYLVAFAVGEFDFVPAGYAGVNRAPVRIVTPKGHGSEAAYAAQVTAPILTKLEEYFGIPFPYEKSDQVAIPVTYGFGAMENAGMVTYAQNILLAGPSRDTTERQRGYASVAAHELAHQWFGDLVTTAWWNDIWLNEAFASWMEQKLVAEWKPEWQTRVEDVNSKLGAEAEDTLLSARKIRQEIKSKDDISNAFDGITYQKGAAVIGMFENWVGPPAFRRGVQAYLRKYAFGNADATEFLASISSTTSKSVAGPFSSFLNQAGVPLVSLALDCKGSSPVLHMQQERSLAINTENPGKQLWQIPVCIRYSSGGSGSESACTLLADPRSDWKLEGRSCPAWVDANADGRGYYRVNYQGTLLKSLTEGNVQERLNAAERVDLLGNAQALANTGKISDGEMLELLPSFGNDPSRYVVERAIAMARAPGEHLVPDNLEENYQQFVRKTFGERARELGWKPKPGENDDARLLRPALLHFVATAGADEQLAKEARELTEKWFSDRNAVPAEETRAVLETAAYYGDQSLFERFLKQFKSSEDRQERRRILGAMVSFRDPAAIEAGMQAVLDGNIPFIEGQQLLYAGQHSEKTRMLAFNFMKQHIDALAAKRPTGGGSDAGARFATVGGSFCDAQSEEDLKQFFEPRVNQFVGAPRMLAQTLESIQSCIANKATQQPSVEQFLKGF